MNPPTPHETSPNFTALWSADLQAAASRQPFTWLWQGYIAPGNVTLLTSRWKSGKTTLVSVLLSRLKSGGVLAGLPLAAGKAVVVTEESPAQWQQRAARLDFGNHVCWLCRPFPGKPRRDAWLRLLDHLAELCRAHHVALVVIDPLAAFLPSHAECSADAMLDALLPLQTLKSQGVSVLLSHHPSKKASAPGLVARGSGSLSAYVDVLIEMHRCTPAETDRRRRLQAFSRYDATPRELVIELTADGCDYVALGDFEAAEFAASWDVLRVILDGAPQKLTRRDILRRWPPSHAAPAGITLWRWLDRAVGQGLLRRDGAGQKKSPFRYWLPSREAAWLADPLAVFRMPELLHHNEPQMNADKHR
jgi:hypothetical protein